MPSNLQWRTGFGWGTLLLPVGAGLTAVLAAGPVRALALAVALVAGGYAGYRYWKWNASGWRKVHYRAMLAYAGIAARERSAAGQAGKEFDVRYACSQLGLLLCGEENRPAVDTMLADLNRLQGAFLAGLVERHGGAVLAGAPPDLRHDIIARLRRVRMGPQLVIAWVIENTYGGREAARYAVAVAAGDAE